MWRINLSFFILIFTISLSFFIKDKFKIYILFFLIFIFPIIAFVLIKGGFGLEYIETREWGGLSLTFILTFFGIIFAFPLGILLALGRRSELFFIRYFSLLFIEQVRGVGLLRGIKLKVDNNKFLDHLFQNKMLAVKVENSMFL